MLSRCPRCDSLLVDDHGEPWCVCGWDVNTRRLEVVQQPKPDVPRDRRAGRTYRLGRDTKRKTA